MRSPGQTYQKMKQARFRHIKREIENLLKQTPKNCVNNTQAVTPSGTLGICKLDCKTCDEKFEDRAETCGNFSQTHGREDVKKSLQEFFSSKTIPEIAIRYPDVAALLWVLDGENPEDGEELPVGSEAYFPGSVLAGTYNGIKIWVDSEEAAQNFASQIQYQQDQSSQLLLKVDALQKELTVLSSDRAILEERVRALSENENKADDLRASIDRISETLRELQQQNLERASSGFWTRFFK